MTRHPVDGHWLDLYALLGLPSGASDEAIRKRIATVYAEAAANSDHRDLARRHYFQALLERVLPQCRRVLLDPKWRTKYDQQHFLHAQNDPAAQNYVAFVASMRGQIQGTGEADAQSLTKRVQDDILIAREVVECAWQGAQLELLPSQSVSNRDGAAPQIAPVASVKAPVSSPTHAAVSDAAPAAKPAKAIAQAEPIVAAEADFAQVIPVGTRIVTPQPPKAQQVTPQAAVAAPRATVVDEIVQPGAALHAQVLTAEEASALRRERAATSRRDNVVQSRVASPNRRGAARSAPVSRFSVGDVASSRRVLSSTSLHLMVAIVGVLLTLTVQQFSGTPAIANNGSGRTPIFVAVSPSMESALQRAEAAWEQTPTGSRFDLVVQTTDSRAGLTRALGAGNALPDVWIPSDNSWVERYNRRAPQLKHQLIGGEESLAQSPMVLIARAERAGELRRLFPNHQITSWQALRGAVMRNAAGHLGLSNPQKTESGALSRLSMAREWGQSRGLSPSAVANNADFWKWMAGFEDNSPSASARTIDMVKDMAQNTTGRFWWSVAYESDALQWMNAGKNLEIFYLPRTTYANHPFCALERVGASGDTAAGRADFEKFLRSQTTQKALLGAGFRPTEINLKAPGGNNPFLNTKFRARGARSEGLPLEERTNTAAAELIAAQWAKRYG